MGQQLGSAGFQRQQTVAEIDDTLIGIQLALADVVGIGDDLVECLVDRVHFDHFLVIVSDVSLDDAFEHIRGIQLVHTILIYID